MCRRRWWPAAIRRGSFALTTTSAALVRHSTPIPLLLILSLAALLLVGLIAGGVGLHTRGAPPDADPPKEKKASPAADAKKPAEPAKDAAEETVECQGRVLDPTSGPDHRPDQEESR